MAILRSHEERKEYERLREIEAQRKRELPYFITQPNTPPDTSKFDPFFTEWTIDNKRVTIEVRASLDGGKNPEGYPQLFAIIIKGKSHFGWLVIKKGKWKWYSGERPQQLAEELGELLIIARYE